MVKIRRPRKTTKAESTFENPVVNKPSTLKEIPKPILLANSKRKSVEPTESAKVRMTMLDCDFLLKRSLDGKVDSLIQLPTHHLPRKDFDLPDQIFGRRE